MQFNSSVEIWITDVFALNSLSELVVHLPDVERRAVGGFFTDVSVVSGDVNLGQIIATLRTF